MLNGIIFRIRSGCQWNRLPKDLGDDSTIHRTFKRWVELVVLHRIWAVSVEGCEELGGVNREWQSADCAMGKARFGELRLVPSPPAAPRPGANEVSWSRRVEDQLIITTPTGGVTFRASCLGAFGLTNTTFGPFGCGRLSPHRTPPYPKTYAHPPSPPIGRAHGARPSPTQPPHRPGPPAPHAPCSPARNDSPRCRPASGGGLRRPLPPLASSLARPWIPRGRVTVT